MLCCKECCSISKKPKIGVTVTAMLSVCLNVCFKSYMHSIAVAPLDLLPSWAYVILVFHLVNLY